MISTWLVPCPFLSILQKIIIIIFKFKQKKIKRNLPIQLLECIYMKTRAQELILRRVKYKILI